MARATRSTSARHVALLVETSKHYGREILLGIGRYLELHGAWSSYTAERGRADPDPAWLADWRGNGIVTRSVDIRVCRAARERGIAVVSLGRWDEKPEFPTVYPDQRLVGKRIAEHLLGCGLQRFGYVGVPARQGWELQRRQAFAETVTERGCPSVAICPTPTGQELTWEEEQRQLAAWVRSLPLPVGIMVNHDTQGVQLLDACRRAAVRVPDDVALVSVDNDPVLCKVATPSLSSLDQHVQRVGFEAAALLDRMMRGREVAARNYFTEPGEVVVRQSSDMVAVPDPRIATAVRYIRENALRGIGVEAVARAAGMSRGALDQRFAECIGCTPFEQLQAARFGRVRQLLLETNYSLPRIAELTGFHYQEYLIRFFKQRAGTTPGRFRRENRPGR